MKETAIREAAEQLVAARRDMRLLPGLPERCRPQTSDDAYAIQEGFLRFWGGGVAGWKIGGTSAEARRMLAVDEPFYGPVFSPLIMRSPAEPAAAKFSLRAIECEFAFRLGDDLPARGRPYGKEEVVGAVQALIPAIELIDTRYDSLTDHGGMALIADCGANGGLVLGEELTDWQRIDLPEHPVTLDVDGERKAEGAGSMVLGSPLEALFWLVTQRVARGAGLRAGEVVTTGTCTGLTLLVPGETAVADFGELGDVQVRFVG
jgi:2-keto-4-pentenoate hydratase